MIVDKTYVDENEGFLKRSGTAQYGWMVLAALCAAAVVILLMAITGEAVLIILICWALGLGSGVVALISRLIKTIKTPEEEFEG